MYCILHVCCVSDVFCNIVNSLAVNKSAKSSIVNGYKQPKILISGKAKNDIQ